MPRDTRVDTYIAGRAEFAQPILSWLRERVHAACPAVEESIKWSMPAFTYKGKPLANMAAFKAHAAFGFWDRQALATGKEGEAMGQYGRIESLDGLPGAAMFEAQVRDAAARIDMGRSPRVRPRRPSPRPRCRPSWRRRSPAMPRRRRPSLASRPAAAANIANGSPRPSAPKPEAKRVAEAVEWMREGKRRNWKYENC
jgi:hypothetical protein